MISSCKTRITPKLRVLLESNRATSAWVAEFGGGSKSIGATLHGKNEEARICDVTGMVVELQPASYIFNPPFIYIIYEIGAFLQILPTTIVRYAHKTFNFAIPKCRHFGKLARECGI